MCGQMSRDDQAEQTENQSDYSPSTQTIRQSTTILVAVARYVECPVNNNQLTKIITQCNLGDPPGYDHDRAEQQSSQGDELCQAEQDGQVKQRCSHKDRLNQADGRAEPESTQETLCRPDEVKDQAEHMRPEGPSHHYGEGPPLKK